MKVFKHFLSLLMCCAMLVPLLALCKVDADSGATLLYTYEQLKSAAKAGGTYALANDIIQTDTDNNNEIVVENPVNFGLDLNGYTLKRSALTVDNCLIHVKDGYLTITDSSVNKTGACIFESSASGSFFGVIYNSGGNVNIHGGTFKLKYEHAEYDSGVLYSEYGVCNIYGGKFDAGEGSGGAAVYLFQPNYYFAAPKCYIYDGEFTAQYLTLAIGAMDKYVSKGVMYSSIYVLGGKFRATKANDDRGGYAYCNNGYGKIITVQGDIPATSPNARDQMYVDGVTKDYYTEDGASLANVYAPAFITDSNEFYETMRFENLAVKHDLMGYNAKAFPTINEMHGDEINAIIEEIPEIVVNKYQTTMPYLTVYSNPKVEKVNWYMASQYNGESTQWYNVQTNDANGLSQWRFAERPEQGGEIYVRAEVTYKDGTTYSDLVVITAEPLGKEISGQVEIINNPEYGNTLTAVVTNAPENQQESDYTYSWVINNTVVSTQKTFDISKTSYIGEKVTCQVSCSNFDGFITSPALEIKKAVNNNYPTTGYISYYNKTITITAMEFEQEYLITHKSDSDMLTEDDWKQAFTPMANAGAFTLEYLGLEEYEGKTVYVYSRFRETNTTQAGKMITCAALMLSDQVSLKTLDFKDIVNKTIYIPFTFEGDTVEIKYDLNPINADKWNSFSWRTSYPLSIVSPTDKVNPENNTGVVTLKITKTGGAQLVASYFGMTEVIYATANIVVYDPNDPNYYIANVAYPLEDQTIKAHTTYTCRLPVLVPTPSSTSGFSWYFTKDSQQGRFKLDSVDSAVIDHESGLIRGLAPGSVDVTLYYGDNALDTFILTIEPNDDWVPVQQIILDKDSLELKVGNVASLSASVYPVNATDKYVAWSSSDPLVVSVDENGNIKALSAGTAVITAVADNIYAHCNVTVIDNPIFNGIEETPPVDDDPPSDNSFILGDVNKNDKIDMTDYILLKRAYFGTFTFDDDQNKRGDINKNNKIDMTDYILLKRVYFGTYTIK